MPVFPIVLFRQIYRLNIYFYGGIMILRAGTFSSSFLRSITSFSIFELIPLSSCYWLEAGSTF